MNLKSTYIKDLIAKGENQQLDFKFEITDSKKIARTLSAFSNTDGGTLLIGVKDNGVIKGINSNEEYHMVEAAAEMYCQPKIAFTAKEWLVEGKTILEIKIAKRNGLPHKAPNHDGKMMVFIRVKDQNLIADSILLKVWNEKQNNIQIKVEYKDAEKALLSYLRDHPQITLRQFCFLAMITKIRAEKILINFILLDIIKIIITENQTYYALADEYTKKD